MISNADNGKGWERLQFSVVVPDTQPAAGAIRDDGGVVRCAMCVNRAGYKAAAARWLKRPRRSFDVEQHGSRPKSCEMC